MRVALFTEVFLPKVDGVVNTLCRVLEHLQKRGHESIVFAPVGGPSEVSGARVVGLPGFPVPMYPGMRLVGPLVNVEAQLARFRADVVHLVSPASMGLAGLRAARSLDLPIVASYQTDLPGYAERWGLGLLREPLWTYFRWLHNQADLNLCPSLATRDELQKQGFRRVALWGRGVDTERFHPGRFSLERRRSLTDGCPGDPLLLYVGRLAPEKRVQWLLPVLKALPQARLAVVGDGPARPQLEKLFRNTRTVFAGFLTGNDLAEAYASADVLAFPAANETFGNVVLEAMASGLPVVAPCAGGPSELVLQGETGLQTECEDQPAFIAAVRRLVQDAELARRLGAAGRKRAESYRWEAVLDGLIADYERATRLRSLCMAA